MSSSRPRPEIGQSAIVLEVRDVMRSRDFYVDVLGFTCNSLWGDPPDFAILQRGRALLMLDRSRRGVVPVNQYWAGYIYATGVDELHASFKAKGANIVRGPMDMPHGQREIDIRDPDGHLVCFGEEIDI